VRKKSSILSVPQKHTSFWPRSSAPGKPMARRPVEMGRLPRPMGTIPSSPDVVARWRPAPASRVVVSCCEGPPLRRSPARQRHARQRAQIAFCLIFASLHQRCRLHESNALDRESGASMTRTISRRSSGVATPILRLPKLRRSSKFDAQKNRTAPPAQPLSARNDVPDHRQQQDVSRCSPRASSHQRRHQLIHRAII
jgi:hypothetical protein